jgi:hypothetical protein
MKLNSYSDLEKARSKNRGAIVIENSIATDLTSDFSVIILWTLKVLPDVEPGFENEGDCRSHYQ